MIEVRDLTKNYGDRTVLDRLSFSLKKGEVLGFLGPNGAGKTTTMRILTGYMPSSDGTATVSGFDVFDKPFEVKKRIGYLPEVPPLYPEMTVRSYLRFAAGLKRMPSREVNPATEEAIAKCGLEEVRNRLIRHLSKGYRQRVGLAQAIINKPEALILDEPTSGLDPRQIIGIRNLIHELSKEQTIILSTHILPEVMAICSRVLIINRGKKVADETLAGLTASDGSRVHYGMKVRKADKGQVAGLEKLEGVRSARRLEGDPIEFRIEARPGNDVAERIAQHAVQQGMGLMELSPRADALEEVFIRLIAQSEQGA